MKKSSLIKVISVLLVMVFLLAASCAPKPKEVAPTAPPAPAAEAPLPTKPTGTLTVAISTLHAERFNPAVITSSGQKNFCRPVIDWMVDTYGSENPPGLAESWEMAPDGLSWTFYLRKGVKFHNGDPMTAKDVKYSLDMMIAEFIYPQLRKTVNRVEIIDDYTVRLHTNKLDPYLISYLGTAGPVLPSDLINEIGIDTWEKNPIGTGPFKFVKQVSGDFVEFKALEEHWRQVPAFETLKLVLMPEEATRVAALETGQADMIDLGFEAAMALKGEGIRAVKVQVAAPNYILCGAYRPEAQDLPIADKRVRQALSLAINRQEIMDTMFYGEALWPLPTALTRPNRNIDLAYMEKYARELYRYDLDEAKRLMAEAGYSDGFDIKLYSYALSGRPYLPKVAEVIAAYWSAIGVNATVLPIDWGTMKGWRTSVSDEIVGVATMFGQLGGPTPETSMRGWFHIGMGLWAPNIMGAPNPEHAFPRLQELIEASLIETDDSKKKEMIREMVEIVAPEYVWVHIAEVPTMVGLGPRIDADIPMGTTAFGTCYEYIKHRK